MRTAAVSLILVLVVLLSGCRRGTPPTVERQSTTQKKTLTPALSRSTGRATESEHVSAADAAEEDDSEANLFPRLDEAFGRSGDVKDGVYRLVTPRPDLLVTMEEMDVPTAAFIESDFRFWLCPCGKALVNGQFVVADYEANDVVDELQENH